MLFYSLSFLILYLPVTVLGWHFFGAFKNRAVSEWFLIGMSLLFYAFFGREAFVILLLCTAVGYGFHLLLWSARSAMQKRLVLGTAIVLYLAILLYYKLRGGVFPVGLSFWLFQLIAFLIARSKGDLVDITLREYLLYLLYFPKLAQGPIALPQEMLTQFRNRVRGRLDRDRILRGLLLFIFGLAKKVLYADTLSPLVQQGFAQTDYLDTLTVLLLLITYAFQLYFDFSGYCDMAMGISEMLMIALPVNFDRPFQADGIGDFWKRWHATLSRFFVRYVYIPLGGSRRGGIRTFGNILIIFLLSGLWHGIGATYLLWGAINGLFVALSHGLLSLRQKRRIDGQMTTASKKEPSGIRRLFTRVSVFAAFLFTLIFFRAESVGKAVMMLKRLCIPLYPGFLYRIAEHLEFTELYPVIKGITMAFPGSEGIVKLFLWVLLVALGFFLISRRNAWEIAKTCRLTGRLAIGMGLLFAWSVLAFNNVGTFLYFAF